MKIAVFMGGSSTEREVSLNSGKAVAAALASKGNDVASYDVQWEGSDSLFTAVNEIRANGTDVVFLALHGSLGENGGVQGILEVSGIPYTCSDIEGSAIAMDKDVSKHLFTGYDIPTAEWMTVTGDIINKDSVGSQIGYPCIVKPADQGSTVGLTLVNSASELDNALELASSFSKKIMVEKYLPGSELTVPVLEGHSLPVIQIKPSHVIYDYECKYTPGMTEYLVPAPIAVELAEEIALLGKRVFNVLGLRDLARIDFRLDEHGKPFCIEANTLPGMTSTSLVPKSALAAGIEFPDLVHSISQMAYNRKRF